VRQTYARPKNCKRVCFANSETRQKEIKPLEWHSPLIISND